MSVFPPFYSYWANKLFRMTTIKDLDTYFYLFRYITSQNEYNFIIGKRMVFSTNTYGTYWTTLLTDDPIEAMQKLALSRKPIYRVGGVPLAAVDRSVIKYQGKALPKYGQPGGATEIIITAPILITSIYDFNNGQFIMIWELLIMKSNSHVLRKKANIEGSEPTLTF